MAIAIRSEGQFVDAAATRARVATLGAHAGKPRSVIGALFVLRRLIRAERLDILHAHGAPSLPLVALVVLTSKPRPKVAFTWHDSVSVLGAKWLRHWLTVWALQRCEAASGSSRSVAQKLSAGTRLGQVGVFHDGLTVCQPQLDQKGLLPLILWLGRIAQPKDPLILIRAVARLRSEGLAFSVCIAGNPIPNPAWYMYEPKLLVRHLGLSDAVRMLGFVFGDNLQDLLTRAEIEAQTSHTEGLRIALLGQMYSGLAIVATDVGDTAAAIENGVFRDLVPSKDKDALAGALLRLLTNLPLRQRIAEAARQNAVECFSIQAMASSALPEYCVMVDKG